jgi:hypothetical protein
MTGAWMYRFVINHGRKGFVNRSLLNRNSESGIGQE